MKLFVEKGDLFSVDEKYYFAHCISSDYAMGAGIAVAFQKKFRIRGVLMELPNEIRHGYPDCIFTGNKVFNLITKKLYWNKPTYESLRLSLEEMKYLVEIEEIKYIAMPKIGCGLDRLQWGKVREIIEDIFKDVDVEILVKYL